MKMIMIKINTNFYCQKRNRKREPSVVTSIKINPDKEEVGVKEGVVVEVEMPGSKTMKIEGSKVSIETRDILNAIIVKTMDTMDIMQLSVLKRN